MISVDPEAAVLWILNGGTIGASKAITVLERDIELPPLTEKDRQAIEIGNRAGIRHVALSFANSAADVDQTRSVAAPGAMIISKIECLNGLFNLSEIATRSDAILIDRGDLSRQVNVEKLVCPKDIIRRSKRLGVPVYVATNLMESMVTSPSTGRGQRRVQHAHRRRGRSRPRCRDSDRERTRWPRSAWFAESSRSSTNVGAATTAPTRQHRSRCWSSPLAVAS